LLFFRWRYLKAAASDQAGVAQRRLTKVFALSSRPGGQRRGDEFQFGTNWPGFMERVGRASPGRALHEVLTAFSRGGFLGVMLFGHGRVSERCI
jgi:cytochrome d ubiquinol oxidase subunit I